MKKGQNLLAQLCVQHPMDGAVFELSARLLDQEPLQKAQKLQKAYRAYTQVLSTNHTHILLDSYNKNVFYFSNLYRDKIRGQKHQKERLKY